MRTTIEERSAPAWTDEQLVGAARDGDADAFAAIYDRYAEALYNAVYRQLGNREEAADVVQDTFVLASERLDQLRDPSRLKSWLYAIATRQALRVVRARLRSTPTDEFGDIVDGGATPDEQAERGDLAVLLRTAAEGLSPTERVILGLHLSGLSPAEIAESVGQRLEGIHVTLHRLRSQVELSLGALLMLRRARRDCDGLATAVGRWDGSFSPRVRKRVVRHVRDCQACQARRSRMMTPEALLALLPWLALPAVIRSKVLERLGLSPAALVAGGAGGLGVAWLAEAGKAPAGPDRLLDPLTSLPTVVKLAVAAGAVTLLIGAGLWRLDRAADPDRPASHSAAGQPAAEGTRNAAPPPASVKQPAAGTGAATVAAPSGAERADPAKGGGSGGRTMVRATVRAPAGSGATAQATGTNPAGQGVPLLPDLMDEPGQPGRRLPTPAAAPVPEGILVPRQPEPRVTAQPERTTSDRRTPQLATQPVAQPVTLPLLPEIGVGAALPVTESQPTGQVTTGQGQQAQDTTNQVTSPQTQTGPVSQAPTAAATGQPNLSQPQDQAARFDHPPTGSGLTQEQWDALPNDAQLAIIGRGLPNSGGPGTTTSDAAQLADQAASTAAQTQQGLLEQRRGEHEAGGPATEAAGPSQTNLLDGLDQQQQQPQQVTTGDPFQWLWANPAEVTTTDPFNVGGTIGDGGQELQLGPNGLEIAPSQLRTSPLTPEQIRDLFGGGQLSQPGQPGPLRADPKLVPAIPADRNSEAAPPAG